MSLLTMAHNTVCFQDGQLGSSVAVDSPLNPFFGLESPGRHCSNAWESALEEYTSLPCVQYALRR